MPFTIEKQRRLTFAEHLQTAPCTKTKVADAGLRAALRTLAKSAPDAALEFKRSLSLATERIKPDVVGRLMDLAHKAHLNERDTSFMYAALKASPRTTQARQGKILSQLRAWRLDGAEGRPRKYLRSEALRTAREMELIRRHSTGFHRPRPDEHVIPAAISGELVLNPGRGRSPFLFRAGDLNSKWRVATRHPDVAAAYATRRTGSHGTDSGVIYALRRKKVRSAGESYADSGTLVPILLGKQGPSAARGAEYMSATRTHSIDDDGALTRVFGPAGRAAGSTTTYETPIRLRRGKESPIVGSYKVRPVRLKDGSPGYGLTTLTGEPASSLFSLVR